MDTIDFIKEIETKYDVRSLKVNDIEIWPFLRSSYFFTYMKKNIDVSTQNILDPVTLKGKRLKNILYGLRNYFKNYDYILVSNTLELRLINEKYINKLADFLICQLNKKKVLLIEYPGNQGHFTHSNLSFQNVISTEIFTFSCLLPIFKKKFFIKNENILNEINYKYKLKIEYNKLVTRFFCYNKLFKIFFNIYKPRLLILSNYYNIFNQAFIYSAKRAGIPTIELQHGMINLKHPGYNVFTKLDRDFFPDYFFAFGDQVNKVFTEKNYFTDKKRVLPIGNMYLDYINNEYESNKHTKEMFNKFRKKFYKIVTVSSQWTIEKKLIEFIKKSSILNKNILYIFVPRDTKKDYSFAKFPSNVVILKDLNVYQIIKESNFHSTVYSTTAVEAPALGVPNILIDIEGMASKYYSEVLTNRDTTRVVEREDEFVDLIRNWNVGDKLEIIKLHDGFYKQDHKRNIKRALKYLNSVTG